MEILVGDKKVLKEGSIVISQDKPISFEIGSMIFVFDFQNNDSGIKEIKQERNEKTMFTHLINFKSSLGTGLTEPAEMATLGTGERLFLSFVIHYISDKLRVFHYTWLVDVVSNV